MDADRTTFQDEVRGPGEPDLARAALLFAREIAYPDLSLAPWLARLDDWAGLVRARCASGASAPELLDALCDFLFDEAGFRGNYEDYDDPRNSYLNEVMARGLGLPISLSVVFLAVAERVGLAAEGVGLPGHFVVAVRLPGERRLLDPFHGGAALSLDDAARLVRRSAGLAGPLRPEWLAPAAPRAILARMLVNLRGVYLQREAWPEALAAVERLALLQSEEAAHLRDLGLLHYRAGSRRLAADWLQKYLARSPRAPDHAQIQRTLAAVLDELARLN